MPLAFDSITHGVVPFGYFNIDTDYLLLHHFVFDTDQFCEAIVTLTEHDTTTLKDGYLIRDPAAMGNVMGAIHGIDRRGFIGAVYERFPFPTDPAAFRQHPEGKANREVVFEELQRWGEPHPIELRAESDGSVCFGEIRFEGRWFHELVAYVWRGGYPRWLDGRRPPPVVRLHDKLSVSSSPLFQGQQWELILCRT